MSRPPTGGLDVAAVEPETIDAARGTRCRSSPGAMLAADGSAP